MENDTNCVYGGNDECNGNRNRNVKRKRDNDTYRKSHPEDHEPLRKKLKICHDHNEKAITIATKHAKELKDIDENKGSKVFI